MFRFQVDFLPQLLLNEIIPGEVYDGRPVNPSKILDGELIKGEVKSGMICDIRKHWRPVPSINKNEKEVFRTAFYDIIDTFHCPDKKLSSGLSGF